MDTLYIVISIRKCMCSDLVLIEYVFSFEKLSHTIQKWNIIKNNSSKIDLFD